MPMYRRRFLLAGLASGALLASGGCQSQPQEHIATPANLAAYTGQRPGAPAAAFPGYVTADLRDGYEFALARPDVLQVLPCYCGCGLNAGHRSNLDCFVAGVDRDGRAVFDDHGSYCQTCVDIARDAKRLVGEGKTLAEIRAYIDERHSAKGPGTDTPKPIGTPAKGG